MAIDQPLVVAHRGSSHDEPEHTLAAYQRALDEGVDALECDVRLTRDGHLVCVHDRRVDRTSSGHGLVSTLELAELAELDFASWRLGDERLGDGPSNEAPDTDEAGVLTFERLLQMVLEAPKPVGLHVETKHPTRYAGLVEQTLVRLLAEYGVTGGDAPAAGRVTVMSFAPLGLRRIRLLAPELPTVLLVRDRTYPAWRDGSLPSGVHIAGPSIGTLRRHPRYVGRLHARGHRAHAWTVDEPADIDLVLELGVDAVITNRPSEVLRRLGRV
ncbi:MAG: glycerophosphodiester phosphodiesterase [Actinomycetota bacterium]|nr:glycerophosphodiester phosphodiesterase [Actinomycetota bacterium]